MLLTLKDDDTTATLHLYHLFYMLSMIMYNRCLHTIALPTDSTIMYMPVFATGYYLHIVSLVGHILLLICIYINIVYLWIYLFHCSCPYNIIASSFL